MWGQKQMTGMWKDRRSVLTPHCWHKKCRSDPFSGFEQFLTRSNTAMLCMLSRPMLRAGSALTEPQQNTCIHQIQQQLSSHFEDVGDALTEVPKARDILWSSLNVHDLVTLEYIGINVTASSTCTQEVQSYTALSRSVRLSNTSFLMYTFPRNISEVEDS